MFKIKTQETYKILTEELLKKLGLKGKLSSIAWDNGTHILIQIEK